MTSAPGLWGKAGAESTLFFESRTGSEGAGGGGAGLENIDDLSREFIAESGDGRIGGGGAGLNDADDDADLLREELEPTDELADGRIGGGGAGLNDDDGKETEFAEESSDFP